MSKYKIEGGIDFYEELYKSLDIEENEQKTDEDNNLCLITTQPLTDKYFQIECGHKFNYIPLYLDIKNHKQKFNGMEGSSSRLQADEIRCPYCRKKQKGLLPYYEELNLAKIHGVNFIDINIKSQTSSHNSNYKTCEFLTYNINFDASGNNPVETSTNNLGNCKFTKCFHLGSQINYNAYNEGENYGDEKHYCWNHKKQMIKKYKQDIKDKAKDDVKKAKLIAKEDAKKAKDEKKQKEKKEKQKIKEETKKTKEESKKTNKSKQHSENVVLGPSIVTDLAGNEIIIGCQEFLKSGPNKGTHCGYKIVSENMCKRHFMMKHKELIINN